MACNSCRWKAADQSIDRGLRRTVWAATRASQGILFRHKLLRDLRLSGGILWILSSSGSWRRGTSEKLTEISGEIYLHLFSGYKNKCVAQKASWASKSNRVIMQRSQIQSLRVTANAPRYVTNHTLHTEFNVPHVSDVIHERINTHHNKLEVHPNPVLEILQQPITNTKWLLCLLDRASLW